MLSALITIPCHADLFPKFEDLRKAPPEAQNRFHSKVSSVLVEIEEASRRNDQFTLLQIGMTAAQAQDVLVDSKIEVCEETDPVCLISGYSGCTKKGRCRPPPRSSCGFRQVNCSPLMGQRPTGGLWCIGQQDSQRHRNLASLCLQAHARAPLSQDLRDSYRRAVEDFTRFWPKFCSSATGGSARSLDCKRWEGTLITATAELKGAIPKPAEVLTKGPPATVTSPTKKDSDSTKKAPATTGASSVGSSKTQPASTSDRRGQPPPSGSSQNAGANQIASEGSEDQAVATGADASPGSSAKARFKNLTDGWIQTASVDEPCERRPKAAAQDGVQTVCLKTCGERELTLFIKQEGELQRLFVLLTKSDSLSEVATLDLEPLSALTCELNSSGFEWFEKTIVRYFREAIRCDQVLGRIESPDELISASQKKSLSCPKARPPRTYSVIWQPEGVRDPRDQVRSYPRLLFDDSRGHRVDCWSNSPLNMVRLANDLFVHRLSRCPKGTSAD